MAKPSPWGGEPERLEPCPFCGGEARRRTYASPDYTEQWVECSGCGCRTDDIEGDPMHVTPVPLWNRRTPNQSQKPSAPDVDPQKILYELDRNSTDVDLYPSVRATCRLAAQLIRARIALGESDP